MTIRVSDTFTVGTDVNLDAHTPTPTGDGWTEEVRTGARYQRVQAADDYSEANNSESSDRHIYTAQPNPTGAEYDVEAQTVGSLFPTSGDDPWFLVARLTGTGDYYSAGVYDASASADKKIFKTVGGSPTELASGSMSAGIAADDILMFEVRDADKKLYKNAGEELSTSNNDITASGRGGFGLGNAWNSTDDVMSRWKTDNFEIDEVTGNGPTPQSVVATAIGVAVVVRKVKKGISATAVGSPSISKKMFETIAATALGVPSISKKMFETITATAVGVPLVTTVSLKTVTVIATAIGVPAVVKTIKKVIAATATANPSVVRKILKTISATAVGNPSVVRKVYKTVAATAIGVPLVATVVTSFQTVTATAIGVATTAQNFIAGGGPAVGRILTRILGALGWIGNR